MTTPLPSPGTTMTIDEMLAAIGWRRINIMHDALAAEDIGNGALRISDRWGPDFAPLGHYTCGSRGPCGKWPTFDAAVEAAYRYHALWDKSVEMLGPGTPLRDFTVAQLEALPVGSAFTDLADDVPHRFDIIRRADGMWAFGDDTGAQRSAGLIEMARQYPHERYVLDGPGVVVAQPEEPDDPDPTIGTATDDAADALAPFALLGSAIPDDVADEYVVATAGTVTVTAGDCRRAARVLVGGGGM